MGASQVSICSNASLMLGGHPINAMDEPTDRARLASNIWPQLRDYVLRAHPWNCAVKRVALPPETTAPKLQPVQGAVIIRRGDTLWRISRRVYGRGMRYSTIYLANQTQISDPDRIWPGQIFSVPDKSKEGEPADMSAMGDQMTTVPAPTTSQ